MKSHTKIILCMIMISMCIAIIYLTNQVNELKSRISMVNPAVSSHTLQYGLVQLESEISYQKKNNWDSAGHIASKIRFIQEGVRATVETGGDVQTLSLQEREDLWNLFFYLNDYITAEHDVVLSKEEQDQFEQLEANLRANGWGLNISYSSDWGYFMERLKAFLSTSK